MFRPLLFFILIVSIDNILKALKAPKTKEQRETIKRPADPKPAKTREKSYGDLREILEKLDLSQEKKATSEEVKIVKNRADIDPVRELSKNREEELRPVKKEVAKKRKNLKRNLINGIIYSEVLSEPVSMRNKTKYMD